jgi:5-methylcytosine-specific restriction endonuclease McrA
LPFDWLKKGNKADFLMSDWIDIKKDPAHIAREKKKAQALRKSQWWKAQIARGICHYCGKTFAPDELTMDHVVPVSRGGRSVKGNVVPCCKSCNNEKKYLTPAEILLKKLAAEKQQKQADTDTDKESQS